MKISHSDSVESSTGFSIDLRLIRPPCGPTIHQIGDLHSIIEIESPNEGNNYLPNLNCLWEIRANKDETIEIKFEKFDLEGADSTNRCVSDYLEISDDEVGIFFQPNAKI